MQLILREDVPSLGKAGDVVKVRDGYARNYLLPKKKAMLANPGNLKSLEVQKKIIEKNKAQQKSDAESVASRLNNLEVTIARAVGANDRLFGSVTKMEISDALRKQGLQIDKHLIELESPIKTIGTFDIGVKLHPELTSTFKLWVIRETK